MTAFVLILTITVAFAHFADFLLDTTQDRNLKQGLSQWYDKVGQKGLTSVAHDFATKLTRFFKDVFGERILSAHAVARVAALSVTISGLMACSILASDNAGWTMFTVQGNLLDGVVIVIAVVFANAAIDIPSFVITRHLLAWVAGWDPDKLISKIKIWLLFAFEVALGYIFLVITVFIIFPLIVFMHGALEGYFLDTYEAGLMAVLREMWAAWLVFFDHYTFATFRDPFSQGYRLRIGDTNIFVFAVTAVLPTLVYLGSVLLAVLFSVFHKILGADLSQLFLRIQNAPQGIFKLVGLSLAGVITIVKAIG